ncbi:ATP-binding cassette domain-containing protein [Patescibacteria group bacterium]|nr:ATP-binding cassette domain-containing protein [Patescibacteria group bacterium]
MIQCENITKTYQTGENKLQVLKGLTFTITRGEFIAIMGASGSGKSTLMHILGALDRPTSGSYLLDEEDMLKLSDDELADTEGKGVCIGVVGAVNRRGAGVDTEQAVIGKGRGNAIANPGELENTGGCGIGGGISFRGGGKGGGVDQNRAAGGID